MPMHPAIQAVTQRIVERSRDTRAEYLERMAALKARGEAYQLVDILDCTPALFRRMYVKSYIDLVQKAPELWGYLYDRTDVVRPATSTRVKARLAFNKANSLPFKKRLAEAAPKAICSIDWVRP